MYTVAYLIFNQIEYMGMYLQDKDSICYLVQVRLAPSNAVLTVHWHTRLVLSGHDTQRISNGTKNIHGD
jgi:hypothetical protein